jgi:hypothetical protein
LGGHGGVQRQQPRQPLVGREARCGLQQLLQPETNHSPSMGIYRSLRPITAPCWATSAVASSSCCSLKPITVPQWVSTAASDQSQPLVGREARCGLQQLLQPVTNHSPSMGIYHSLRPITVSQRVYTAASDQSQSLDGHIPQPETSPDPSHQKLQI